MTEARAIRAMKGNKAEVERNSHKWTDEENILTPWHGQAIFFELSARGSDQQVRRDRPMQRGCAKENSLNMKRSAARHPREMFAHASARATGV